MNDERENSTKAHRVSLQQLYVVIQGFAHDDAPLAVDQNAEGIPKLPVSTAIAADGSYVAAIAVTCFTSSPAKCPPSAAYRPRWLGLEKLEIHRQLSACAILVRRVAVGSDDDASVPA